MLIIVMHLYTWIALLMAITSVANSFSICEPCPSTGPEHYEGGNVTIYGSGGVFRSPTQPAHGRQGQTQRQFVNEGDTYRAEMCPDSNAKQMKLKIDMNLNRPNPKNGECDIDKLEIKGANEGVKIPVLCGKVDDTLYIDIDKRVGPLEIILTRNPYKVDDVNEVNPQISTVPEKPSFEFDIAFLTEADAVPYRCLQYKTEVSGTLKSFNYGEQSDGISEPLYYTALNNQRYSICFAYIKDFCDIEFKFTRFDIGNIEEPCTDNNRYLLIGDDKYCGDFTTNFEPVKVNDSGPIIVNVRMVGNNLNKEEGFFGTYEMKRCQDVTQDTGDTNGI